MLSFRFNYFFIAIGLFITEVLIAVYVNDNFIRPYFGDFLVVILLYCALMTIVIWPPLRSALVVLAFSYLIETLQYFNIVKHLGLAHHQIANIVIGNYFAWEDILAYTLGIMVVLGVEGLKVYLRRNSEPEETFQYFI